MDWVQEEFEALPIPTYPGSSLSVLYCYDNMVDPGALRPTPALPQENGAAYATDGEPFGSGWFGRQAGGREGPEDADDSKDDEDRGGCGGSGGSTASRNDDVLAEQRLSQTNRQGVAEAVDGVVLDEFGFLALSDPGLDDALHLTEPPPSFDETGLATYKELCRSMQLKPIQRFERQLHEGVVDLKFYGVSSRTLRAVAQALMYNPSVHTLDLAGNWLSAEAAFYMAELLLRENVALSRLVLRGCRLGARAAELLAEGIELNHSLELLDLADNQIGDDGVRAMQDALAQNDKLCELDLSNNHLGAVASASLAKSLLENQTVEVLRLAQNNLYEDVTKGLGGLLRSLHQREKSLKLLDLAWNGLNVSAALPLKTFLIRGKVQELFLDHNRFSGPAINIIKIGVGKSSSIQHLKIGFNPIEAESAMNLLRSCQHSSTVKILDLDGIRVQRDFIRLKEQLENSRDISVIIEGTLSDYEVNGPNLAEMMLKRARYEGLKPKKKKRKKDFGHLLLQMAADGTATVPPEQFTDAALKLKKLKVRIELLRAICEQFQLKKTRVDVSAMLDCYMQLFPDTKLPPPKPKKKRRGKKRRLKRKTRGKLRF